MSKTFNYSILLIFTLLFICTIHCKSQSNFELNINLAGIGFASECRYDSIENYFVQIELRNCTDTTQYPWIMNCSWHDNFLIKPDEFEFCWFGCDRNFLEEFELNPGQKIKFHGILSPNQDFNSTTDSLQIGFIFIEGSINDPDFTFYRPLILEKRIKNKEVEIWSDFLKLENVNNKYEIK